MNATKAAKILDAIRNDRTTDIETLRKKVDEVGIWAAAALACKYSKKTLQVCQEASELRRKLGD